MYIDTKEDKIAMDKYLENTKVIPPTEHKVNKRLQYVRNMCLITLGPWAFIQFLHDDSWVNTLIFTVYTTWPFVLFIGLILTVAFIMED